jgi:peptide/nickel transport system permease protein
MTSYLARRALQALVVLVLVSLVVFLLLRLTPGGSEAAALGASTSHEQFLLQYLSWLGQVLHGDLGFAAARNMSVGALLAASLPRTLALTVTSTLIALIVGIPLGLLQAARHSRMTDHAVRGATLLFYGSPAFVLGPVLILVFAVRLHAFGAEGPQAAGFLGVISDWRDLTLPVATLSLVTIALFARYTRASALDSLAQDYVEAARARGAGERRVLSSHVLRNSLVPVVTLVGLSLPQIVGGAVVVESLFNIQGMGWQIWQAAQDHDFPVTLGFTLVIAAGAVVGSLLADVGHALLDPRVRGVRA